MTAKKYNDHFHFVYWWIVYSARQNYPKSANSNFENIPEMIMKRIPWKDYVHISETFSARNFDDDHFLDVIEANIIMNNLDFIEKKAVVADTLCYVQHSTKNIGHDSIRRSARKLSRISSPRLFADKLRTGISKINNELRRKDMIYR